jgi:hypothetical protein
VIAEHSLGTDDMTSNSRFEWLNAMGPKHKAGTRPCQSSPIRNRSHFGSHFSPLGQNRRSRSHTRQRNCSVGALQFAPLQTTPPERSVARHSSRGSPTALHHLRISWDRQFRSGDSTPVTARLSDRCKAGRIRHSSEAFNSVSLSAGEITVPVFGHSTRR